MTDTQNFLAIDFSGDMCSIALSVGSTTWSHHESTPRRQSEQSMPIIFSFLKEAGISLHDVSAFVVGRGPGSFTGIRLAVSLIQGLAFSTGKPVIGISSLAILAQHALESKMAPKGVAAAIDARMGQVYWGLYQKNDLGVAVPIIDDVLVDPEKTPLPLQEGWSAIGTGFRAYSSTLTERYEWIDCNPEAGPRADDAITLARFRYEEGAYEDAATIQPVYLRDQVVNP